MCQATRRRLFTTEYATCELPMHHGGPHLADGIVWGTNQCHAYVFEMEENGDPARWPCSLAEGHEGLHHNVRAGEFGTHG